MILSFQDFIKVDYHISNVNQQAQRIKSQSVTARKYLESLFDLFFNHIEEVSDEIYKKYQLDKNKNKKFDDQAILELKNLIFFGTKHFLNHYESIIISYNMGNMFGEYHNLNKDLANFKRNADNYSKEKSESISSKYDLSLKNERLKKTTFLMKVIAKIIENLLKIKVFF